MAPSALVTLIIAWSFISYFTIRFFLKVLKAPQKHDGDS
jgi:hypothetical protein